MSAASQYLVRTMVIADLQRKYESDRSEIVNYSFRCLPPNFAIHKAHELPVESSPSAGTGTDAGLVVVGWHGI